MAIGLSVLGGVLLIVCVAAIFKLISAQVKSRKIGCAPAYVVQEAFQSSESPPAHVVEAYDGPTAFQLDEISKAR